MADETNKKEHDITVFAPVKAVMGKVGRQRLEVALQWIQTQKIESRERA